MTIAALLIALIATPGAEPKDKPVLLDFHASWCGPCRQMRPAVDQLSRQGYPIRSIDIDRSPRLAERYEVKSVPTFIVIDASGRALGRTEGLQPAGRLASFYRTSSAKAKARANDHDENDRENAEDADSTDANANANANDDAERDDDAPAPRTLPKPWETVVRIKVHGNGTIGFGSGTIIHSTPEESTILTCAHIFKIEGQRPVHPSKFPLRITIDLFDGRITSYQTPQVHKLETVEGKAVDYDFARDVGLIRIRPGRRLAASPVVPQSWSPRQGMRMTTVGCSLGQDATAWSTSIRHTMIRGLSGSPDYEAMECQFAPKQGRSGGGLYTQDGYVAGVCDFAEPHGNVGLYATPRSIYRMLDRNRLTALYSPGSGSGKALLAKNTPRSQRTSAPAIARAQSPDHDESGDVTIPRPELLGIKPPALAANESRPATRRPGWQTPKPARRPRDDQEPAQSTELTLSKDVDSDPLDAAPEQPERPSAQSKKFSAPRSSTRWRAVQAADPATIEAATR
jgi:thiol-disulfide isomerase/thioredoxin